MEKVTLEQGQQYEAEFALGIALGAVTPNDSISKKLKEEGFSFLQVKGSGSKRIARGIWNKATQPAPKLPDFIKIVSIKKV